MTIIYPSPIFGPVHSRRLGVSLGINLLPDDGKVCSFDCITVNAASMPSIVQRSFFLPVKRFVQPLKKN